MKKRAKKPWKLDLEAASIKRAMEDIPEAQRKTIVEAYLNYDTSDRYARKIRDRFALAVFRQRYGTYAHVATSLGLRSRALARHWVIRAEKELLAEQTGGRHDYIS
jgi:hypothetical protein